MNQPQFQRVGARAEQVTRSLDTLLANMQAVDKSDPRFTARMRQYGLIQNMSDLAQRIGDLGSELAAVFRELEGEGG